MRYWNYLKELNKQSHDTLKGIGILTIVCFHFFIFYTYNPLGILTFGDAVVDKTFEIIVNIFASLISFLLYMLVYFFIQTILYWYFSVLVPAFENTRLKSGDKK